MGDSTKSIRVGLRAQGVCFWVSMFCSPYLLHQSLLVNALVRLSMIFYAVCGICAAQIVLLLSALDFSGVTPTSISSTGMGSADDWFCKSV